MEPLLGPFLWLVDLVGGRQRVQVLVHREVNGQPVVDMATGTPVVCMKVTNLSNTHDIQITHIWYEGTPSVPLFHPQRGWRRLPPAGECELCIPVDQLAHIPQVEVAGRVRLTRGRRRIVRSKPNRDVPPIGRTAPPCWE